jgi:hypothetical protein
MFRLLVAASFAFVLGTPALAQAQLVSENRSTNVTPAVIGSLKMPAMAAAESAAAIDLPRPVMIRTNGPSATRAALYSLYATTATMQMLDVDSTLKSLGRGAVETNPMMAGLVNNRAVFIATKAGIAAAMIYATNRMAKRNKLGAIATLVAMNSAYAMIVKHNYSIANR